MSAAAYLTLPVASLPAALRLLSAHLAESGARTRDARAAAIGLSASALGDLERGDRGATADEAGTLRAYIESIDGGSLAGSYGTVLASHLPSEE